MRTLGYAVRCRHWQKKQPEYVRGINPVNGETEFTFDADCAFLFQSESRAWEIADSVNGSVSEISTIDE